MLQVWNTVKGAVEGGPVVVTLSRETRTLDQNAKMWPMLKDVSDHVEWYGQYLIPENWKDVFTAALNDQKAVPGINGGVVFLGKSTSKMKKAEFSDLIECMYAFGAEHDVQWSEKSINIYNEYGQSV